ncbi:ethanolamine ammonia-lyase subunit EutB [Clostridium sp. Cult2]|uniref:ethanolamine ammonia-lyase subunit EutB n=1 Tax=Clostridium sp. Cult2 TaxID=2079003 RepID=UPI001F3E45F4|nr:ethanolamine ammonia-lyase subunit EutB [Clostridium sp. Cult2]MCF6466266.1 ethanolamine ammonia lyase large subunit [Clostridium sp. Cult2]
MRLKTKLFGTVYQFEDIKEVLAKANEERSGDKLAGIAAESVTEMIAAKEVLSNLTLQDLRNNPVVPYEEDEVTRVIQDLVNEKIYNQIKNWTVAELREWILDTKTTSRDIRRISRGLTSEMVAAVAKLMTNLDLLYGANKIIVEAHCNTTIGSPNVFALRLQPNHPSDNLDGILISIYEGLSYGSGDAVIGFNPVNDTVENVIRIFNLLEEVKTKWEIPTQHSVLSHVTTQMEAIKKGAPADMIFQSIAGTQKGNEAFGITAELLDEARELVLKEGRSTGPNVMYFETGQGAELSSNAHHNVDQVTLEARCYGFAKRYEPFLVNTVVGFIGPEYLYDNKQVIRAGLEDHFMGKLTGISMGVDICHTNHMKADQNDLENLSVLLATAGVNFIITAPQGDDVMLNYQSASYHDGAAIREMLGLRPIREFEDWLGKMGIYQNGKLTEIAGDASIFI